MEPESTIDFIMRTNGFPNTKPESEPDMKSDPLGYIMGLAKTGKNDLYQALLTNEPAENLRQSFERSIPSGVGATIGGTIGGAAGALSLGPLGAVPGSYAGMAAGGAGGEFARQGLVGLNAALGNTQAPTPGQVGLAGLKEGTLNAAVPAVAGPLVKAAGKTITGISGMAMDRLLERPSEVATQAMLNPEAAPALAKQFVNAVNANMDRAGEAYRSLINGIFTNPKYAGFTINLKDQLMDTVGAIRKDFGYGLPGRLAEESDAKLFTKFSNGLDNMAAATPEEAYYFQKDLTNAIRNNPGKPISAALGRLKSGVLDIFDNIGSAIPEIGMANKIYRGANELLDDLSKVTNADNALSVLKSAWKNKNNTFDALGRAADQVAGGRKLLESIKDAAAGGELSPAISSIPRTGFATGLGLLAREAGQAGNPAAQAAAAATLPFLSPKTVAYGTRAAMSIPGQLLERPVLSAAMNELLGKAGMKQETPAPINTSTIDFILRSNGIK